MQTESFDLSREEKTLFGRPSAILTIWHFHGAALLVSLSLKDFAQKLLQLQLIVSLLIGTNKLQKRRRVTYVF